MKAIERKGLAIAIGVIGLGTVSCTTIQNTASTVGVQSEIVNLTVAETKVADHKVSKTTEWKWTPFTSIKLDAVKDRATAKLLEETDADVLVEPRYEVKRRGFMRGGSLTVTGYPATYTGFHPLTEGEAEAINKLRFPTIYSGGEMKSLGYTSKKKATKSLLQPRHRKTYNGYSALNLTVGYLGQNGHKGADFGLMYSRIGSHKWGWFGKFNFGFCDEEFRDRYDWYNEKGMSLGVTAGVVRALSNVTSLYLGTGISAVSDAWDHGYESFSEAAIPIDFGAQFRFGSLNALVGIRYNKCPDDYNEDCNMFSPYVGVGFTF